MLNKSNSPGQTNQSHVNAEALKQAKNDANQQRDREDEGKEAGLRHISQQEAQHIPADRDPDDPVSP